MDTYIKVANISELFAEKEDSAFGLLTYILRSLFLFGCLVVFPSLFLLSEIDFSTQNINWLVEIGVLALITLLLIVVFIITIMVQAYFYRSNHCEQLAEACQLHLTTKYGMFSLQYAAFFDLTAQKIVLSNHYKKVFLVKNYSDIVEWDLHRKKSSDLSVSKKIRMFQRRFFDLCIHVRENDENHMFTFMLSKKQGKRWLKILEENLHPSLDKSNLSHEE